MTTTWTKCRNCGADYGLHNGNTDQCPRNGVESPIGRKQEWESSTFEAVDNRDETIATLRSRLSTLEAAVEERDKDAKKTRQALEWIAEMAGYAVYHLDPEWASKNRSDLEDAIERAQSALAETAPKVQS